MLESALRGLWTIYNKLRVAYYAKNRIKHNCLSEVISTVHFMMVYPIQILQAKSNFFNKPKFYMLFMM